MKKMGLQGRRRKISKEEGKKESEERRIKRWGGGEGGKVERKEGDRRKGVRKGNKKRWG